jgi:hypothetical protein
VRFPGRLRRRLGGRGEQDVSLRYGKPDRVGGGDHRGFGHRLVLDQEGIRMPENVWVRISDMRGGGW